MTVTALITPATGSHRGLPLSSRQPIMYPESDGQPMADNTRQFDCIVMIQGGLAVLFADRSDVFVAGDLLWYPVEGEPLCRGCSTALPYFCK